MNIAEILKNAPKGTRLYSTLCGEVTLNFVDGVNFIHTETSQGNDCTFLADGKFNPNEDSECLLFPSKDKRDWLGWQHELFKKGDIVAYDKGNIVKVIDSVTGVDAYGIERQGLLFSNWRYATEEEKDMFYSIFDSCNEDDGGTISAGIKETFDKINFLLDSILDKLGSLQEIHNDFQEVIKLLSKHDKL